MLRVTDGFRLSLWAVALLAGLIQAAIPAVANVNLQWRTTTPTVCVGDIFTVDLFVASDNPNQSELFIAADIGFAWDQPVPPNFPALPVPPTHLRLVAVECIALGGQSTCGLLCPDSACRANELCPQGQPATPPGAADGDAFLNLRSTSILSASPGGSKLATFRWEALSATPVGTPARIEILFRTGLQGCITKVFDETVPNLNILNQLTGYGSTAITVVGQQGVSFTNQPVNTTVECTGGDSTAALNAWLASATSVSPCRVITVTNDFSGLASGCGGTRTARGANGNPFVTWTADDNEGSTTTTTATFNVVDTTPPALTVPANISVNSDSADCKAHFSTFISATATDACGTSTVTFQRSDGQQGLTDPYDSLDSPIRITWTATDQCGLTATGVQTVTVGAQKPVLVDIELSPTLDDPSPSAGDVLERCITFELWACPGATTPTSTVQQLVAFPVDSGQTHRANNVTLLAPCGAYTCLTARDRLHTLRSTAPDFTDAGSEYRATFVGNDASDGHWLVNGNMNDDFFIDILDFGLYVNRFQSSFGGPGTNCATPFYHGDFSGDGRAFTEDFTFIAIHVLKLADANCCGVPDFLDGVGGAGPLSSIAVADLWRHGMGELAAADLNGDGMLDLHDMSAFAQSEDVGLGVIPSSVKKGPNEGQGPQAGHNRPAKLR